MAINTHQGTNIEGGWIIYRNSINAFRTILTGLDTSALVFSMEFYTPGGTTAKLTLTEASGAITNDDAGTIDYSLSVANLATLPRDRYFFVIKYTSGSDTYPLAQGFTNITSETNPGTTLTSVTIPVNVNSTQVNMSVTLIAGGLAAHLADTDNPHEVTAEQLSIAVNVDDEGAVGDGSADDSTAISAACTTAGTKGVVMLTKNKTYLINKEFNWPNGVTVIGYGATLKRANEKKTTTTAIVLSGATSVPVTDASVFSVGDYVILLDAGAANGGQAQGEACDRTQISAIVGNTLTVGAIANGIASYPSGTVVVKMFNMMNWNSNNTDIKIYGLTFDGNRDNNSTHLGWSVGYTVYNIGRNGIIRDCKFINIPRENILTTNYLEAINNYADGTNGSFCHLSSSDALKGFNKFIGNSWRNICETDNAINGHNESCITFSSTSVKTIIANNSLYTCGGMLFGIAGSDDNESDDQVICTGNYCEDITGITKIYSNDPNNVNYPKGYTITGNYFKNFEFLVIAADNASKIYDGAGTDRVNISSNTFINGKFKFEDVSNLIFSGNNVIFEDGYDPGGSEISTGTSYDNAINLNLAVGVTITNNNIVNYAATQDSDLIGGIRINLSTQNIKSDASTNTVYRYGGRNILIANNTIRNFSYGIRDSFGISANSRGGAGYINCVFRNNIIMLRATSGVYGIECSPGMLAEGNKIFGNVGSGLKLYGASSARSTDLQGGIGRHNTIVGFAESIEMIENVSTSTYNARAEYNYIDGTVDDNSGGNSTAANNTSIINETVRIDMERANPNFY